MCDDPSHSDVQEEMKEEHFGQDGSTIVRRKKARCIYFVGYNREHDAENFFREMLMLYVPWRNEAQILGSCVSYEDRFNEMQPAINEKKVHYVCTSSTDISNLAQDIMNSDLEHDTVVSESSTKKNRMHTREADCTKIMAASTLGIVLHMTWDWILELEGNKYLHRKINFCMKCVI